MSTTNNCKTARKKVFEYLVILHDPEDANKSVIIDEGGFILASNEEEAKTLAIMGIDKEFADDISNLEILVRPF